MTTLYPNLTAMMREHGLTIDDLAAITSRSAADVSLKMDGTLEWSIYDAVSICRYLQCSDLQTLFQRKL